jgi:lipopolysaccharide export system permease protein
LGLPLVVNRGDKRLFSVIGQALGIIMLFFGLKTVSAAMASSGYFLSPGIAAWIPLLVLGPLAYVRYLDAQAQ